MEEITCEFCGKIMEGYSKNHVEYMLAQHILSKHPNKNVKREKNN